MTAHNVRGNSGDPNRGTWCTPAAIAHAVGSFDLDPFSNPRSHIAATRACMLEDGGDGLLSRCPGAWRSGSGRSGIQAVATAPSRVWLQPPYTMVAAALDHYEHTRFVALLRFDPRTAWFRRLYKLTELCCVIPTIAFEPPPGVKPSSNTFPHAIYYRHASDVTPAILRMTIAWKTR